MNPDYKYKNKNKNFKKWRRPELGGRPSVYQTNRITNYTMTPLKPPQKVSQTIELSLNFLEPREKPVETYQKLDAMRA